MAEYPTVRWLPKNFPLLDGAAGDTVSEIAARASLAAHYQGKFAEFHEAIFTNPSGSSLSEGMVYNLAEVAGLDLDRLRGAMNNPQITKELSDLKMIGEDSGYWQTGTPGYLIGTTAWIGGNGIEHMRAMIEDELAKQKTGR